MAELPGGGGLHGLDPADVHRLLILFGRANVSKTGELNFGELTEISWMVMLGQVATTCGALLEQAGEAAVLGPDGWLEMVAAQFGGDAAVSTCA